MGIDMFAPRWTEVVATTAGTLTSNVGNSGNASGSPTHLHFEVRDHGRVMNPYAVLARAEPVEAEIRVARSRWTD